MVPCCKVILIIEDKEKNRIYSCSFSSMDKETCQLSHPGITGLTMVNSICSPICTVKLVSLVDVIPISLMMQSSIQIYIWCKKSRADPESLS